MSNGYWENMVKIDMTTESIEYTKDHMQYVEEYLGGRALGIKMLWEALIVASGSIMLMLVGTQPPPICHNYY